MPDLFGLFWELRQDRSGACPDAIRLSGLTSFRSRQNWKVANAVIKACVKRRPYHTGRLIDVTQNMMLVK
jgi:hypothetical protein